MIHQYFHIKKSKHILTVIVFFWFLVFSGFSNAQEIKTTRDIGLWLNVGVKYKFHKSWSASLNQGFRTYDNAIRMDKLFTDLGITYKINKKFKLGVGLRYAYARKKTLNLTHDARYDLNLRFKQKLTKNFSFHYRLRFQHRFTNLLTYYKDVNQNSHLRNKVKFEYELGKHALYFSTELFLEFKRYKKPKFDNLRFVLGDEFHTKSGELNYSLGYELELSDPNPLHFFYLNIGYVFEFERK